MIEQQVDILIVGGGLTGAILMLALAKKGLSTLLVDVHSFNDKVNLDFDARTLALSPTSVRILNRLAVWPLLVKKATPIESIHISEQYRFGTVILHNNKHDKLNANQPLGFVIEMQHINQAVHQLLDHNSIRNNAQLVAIDKTSGLATIVQNNKKFLVHATMIVAADGTHSLIRHLSNLAVKKKDYGQQAIITNIGLNRSHNNRAYERFTASGPLAILPMTDNRASLVWVQKRANVARFLDMGDHEFLRHLNATFGYRLGRFNKVGKRFTYPLYQVIMPKSIAWPLVFIGNAAHTLHPVAGQGFNLGLRDVAGLAQCIMQYGLNSNMLLQYQSMRHYDQLSIARFTDGLVNIFTNQIPGLGILRSFGLLAVDNIPYLKKILIDHARGFAGTLPDLVCDINNEQDHEI